MLTGRNKRTLSKKKMKSRRNKCSVQKKQNSFTFSLRMGNTVRSGASEGLSKKLLLKTLLKQKCIHNNEKKECKVHAFWNCQRSPKRVGTLPDSQVPHYWRRKKVHAAATFLYSEFVLKNSFIRHILKLHCSVVFPDKSIDLKQEKKQTKKD